MWIGDSIPYPPYPFRNVCLQQEARLTFLNRGKLTAHISQCSFCFFFFSFGVDRLKNFVSGGERVSGRLTFDTLCPTTHPLML